MKNLILAAVAASVAVAAPAYAADNAAFVGPRVELTAGVDDVTGVRDTTDIVYGAAVGIDAPVGDNFTLGIEANTSNVFDDQRQIGAAARLGYAFNESVLGYAKAGYNNYRDVFSRELDGAQVGAGVEVAVAPHAFVKAEYKYSDFDGHVGNHGGLVGVGLRF